MATLIRRRETYYARWWEGGKEHWKALSPNKLVAQQKLLDIGKAQKSRRYGDPVEAREITWTELAEKFLGYCQTNMAQATRERNAIVLANFNKAILIHRLSELTAELLEEFKVIRRNAGIMPSTINREITVLRQAAALGKQWNYSTSDLGMVKKLPVPKKRPVFFTQEELQIMVQKADPFWRTVVFLGYHAGLRLGEMLHLEWQDVDFEKEQLRITPRNGWNPKDGEPREIDLHPSLADHLKAWKPLCQDHGRVVPWDRKTHQFSMMFSSHLRRCGIAKGSLHTLRHSFASHLAMADVNLVKIARLMGHSDISTTQIYAHLQPSSLKEAVRRLVPINQAMPISSNGTPQV
ncbi:MAG: site-specific integrase [Elusimicrobia bacterium]|nr:site-specific integrase [Elusimicrobiota bacterium]